MPGNGVGLNDVNWGQVGMSSAVGGVAGMAGFAAGSLAINYLSSPLISGFNINSPVLSQGINGMVGGAAGGYAGGFSVGLMLSGGDFSAANQAGWNDLKTGALIGGASGVGSSYLHAKQAGISPWTGKAVESRNKSIHAIERSIQRNVSQADIQDALQSPLKTTEAKYDSQGYPSVKYIGASSTVVVNPETGKIITVYPTSSQRRSSLSKTK
ncbi:MAG: DUF4258 domain-containing protein [Mangrovibacterium sp.]